MVYIGGFSKFLNFLNCSTFSNYQKSSKIIQTSQTFIEESLKLSLTSYINLWSPITTNKPTQNSSHHFTTFIINLLKQKFVFLLPNYDVKILIFYVDIRIMCPAKTYSQLSTNSQSSGKKIFALPKKKKLNEVKSFFLISWRREKLFTAGKWRDNSNSFLRPILTYCIIFI